MRQYQVDPSAAEIIGEQMRETITHHFRHILPGFIEYCLVDCGNGSLLAFGIFEEQALATGSAHVAAGYVRDHFAAFVDNIPQPTKGRVVVRVTGQAQDSESTP
jgi:hypothetical protein